MAEDKNGAIHDTPFRGDYCEEPAFMHRYFFRLLEIFRKLFSCRIVLFLLALAGGAAQATPIYQPPGVNLVYGDSGPRRNVTS